MAILFESISDEPTEYQYNGETIVNFGKVVICENIDDAN